MIDAEDHEILTAIKLARGSNNMLWMSLVEIALEHAPDRTKQVLKAINANDRRISELLQDLAK